MREKLARFMQGRYGIDELGRFMTGASLAIVILELITGWYALTLVFWAIFIVIYYRMFSRDYGKRQQENQKFLTARYKFKAKWYQTFHKNNNSYGKTGDFRSFKKICSKECSITFTSVRAVVRRFEFHVERAKLW